MNTRTPTQEGWATYGEETVILQPATEAEIETAIHGLFHRAGWPLAKTDAATTGQGPTRAARPTCL